MSKKIKLEMCYLYYIAELLSCASDCMSVQDIVQMLTAELCLVKTSAALQGSVSRQCCMCCSIHNQH